MKKLLVLISLLIPMTAWGFGLMMSSGTTAGGGGACDGTADLEYTSGASQYTFMDDSAYVKFGPLETMGSDECVCRIDIELYKAAGDISGLTYQAEIWTRDVGDDLLTELGTSSTVAGDNGWSATWVQFDFDTCVQTGAQTVQYILSRDDDGWSASNYIGIYWNTAAATPWDATDRYQGDGTQRGTFARAMNVKIYW